MTSYLEKKKARRREVAALLGISEDAPTQEEAQSKLIASIYAQYPGVPEPYPLVWDRSDTEILGTDEWKEAFQSAAEAFRRAAEVCDQIATQTERTKRNQLITNKNILLCGIHKAEDAVDQLGFKYPLDDLRNYKLAKANPEISNTVPEVLINTDTQILIWMPRLPSKARGTDSMEFQELQELLWDTDFSHYDKWHCDFIHVYKPNDLNRIYDVDNYAYKPICDAICRAVRSRDNLDHFGFSMYNFASETIKNGTFIHVYKRDEKVSFFKDFEKLVHGLL